MRGAIFPSGRIMFFGVFLLCVFPGVGLWAEPLNFDGVRRILKEAREHVLRPGDSYHRYSHLQSIAEAQAKAGDVDEAVETANEMGKASRGRFDSLFTQESALWAVHSARYDLGDIEGAAKVQPYLGPEGVVESKDILSRLLVEQKAIVRDYDGARQAVAEIVDPNLRARSMVAIALGQARSDDLPNAMRTARSITDNVVRAMALRSIAVAQAERDDFGGALRTARVIVEENEKDDAFWEIALVLAHKRAFAEAVATIERIGNEEAYHNAIFDIANVMAREGQVELALKLARKVSARWKRAIGVQEIARIQALSGDRIGAEKTLRIAYRNAQEEHERWLKVRALIPCVGASALVGNEEEALKIAASLPNDAELHETPMRHQAFMAIVESLGRTGRIDSALQVEKLIFEQVRALATVQKYSEQEVSRSVRLEVYPAIIRAYSRAGHGAEALMWAQELSDSEVKGRTLLAVAEGSLEFLQPSAKPIKKMRFGFPL